MRIKSIVVEELHGPLMVKEVELDTPKHNEVLIQVVGSGICHTDFAVKTGRIPSHFPIALGHEGAGIVKEIGPGVTGFSPGDHVVVSFPYCGHCKNCLTGHPSSCESSFPLSFGGKMLDGTYRIHDVQGKEVGSLFGQASLSSYVVSHTNNLVKVDPEVDLRLLGPLACGIQTGAGTVLNKLKPSVGESIVVFGCGGVGMSAVMGAQLASCSTIIAVDVVEERLALAKELGATHTLNGKTDDVVAKIREITGSGADYAVESVGNSVLVKQAVHAIRPGGKVALVGGSGETTLHIHDDLIAVNKSLIGVVEGDSIPSLFINSLISLYKKGQFPFDKLIRFYQLDELSQAVEDMHSGRTIKPVILF
ncbi:UNVERIFIED_CONTAM: aryl-alcohol dehydrogenase [Brevibacillus sp. OAP136]